MARGRTSRVVTRRWDGDRLAQSPDEVAVEEPLEVLLDGALATTTMRTPGHDFELAVGFCHTEGLLAGAPVRAAKYCRGGGPGATLRSEFNVVTVDTGGLAPSPPPRLTGATSACGMCGSTAVDDLRERLHALPPAEPVGIDVVLAVTRHLTGTPLLSATGAVHVAAAFLPTGEPVVVREDVGRHNAADKVVGRLLLDGRLPATGWGLAVSGRVGFEIVQKAWAAGIGTVVAVGAPTSLAVQAATLAGMTLVGWVRDGGARVYVGELRGGGARARP